MKIDEPKSSIIKSINSSLGFFALSLLIVEGFLGIVLIYSGLDAKGKFLGMLIGAGLFVLVIIIVSLLVAFKPKNIMFGEESHLIEEGKLPIYGESGEILTKPELEKLKETSKPETRS